MNQILIVGMGGFLGAVSRFLVSQLVRTYLSQSFPFSTLIINITGCFAIGMLFEFLKDHPLLPLAVLFGAIGFLGSFTTFSAFGFETIELIRMGELRMAMLNVMGNVILGLTFVMIGMWIGHYLKV